MKKIILAEFAFFQKDFVQCEIIKCRCKAGNLSGFLAHFTVYHYGETERQFLSIGLFQIILYITLTLCVLVILF